VAVGRAGLAGLADEAEAGGLEAGRSAHAGWWGALWGRSYVDLAAEGDGGDAAAVSRGQCLERYLQVCAGRGAQPIKFNGNLFSVEERGFDADFRQVTTRGIRMARGAFYAVDLYAALTPSRPVGGQVGSRGGDGTGYWPGLGSCMGAWPAAGMVCSTRCSLAALVHQKLLVSVCKEA
jgi:hypothetical protein